MKISKLYCNLQYKSRKGRYQGGYHIYIYMYIHNIKCDIFVDSPAYEFLLHVHIDSKDTCCQLPPEAFHAVLDGLSNADKKKFLMFVTGIEAYGLLPYKAGAYPSYNRALLWICMNQMNSNDGAIPTHRLKS